MAWHRFDMNWICSYPLIFVHSECQWIRIHQFACGYGMDVAHWRNTSSKYSYIRVWLVLVCKISTTHFDLFSQLHNERPVSAGTAHSSGIPYEINRQSRKKQTTIEQNIRKCRISLPFSGRPNKNYRIFEWNKKSVLYYLFKFIQLEHDCANVSLILLCVCVHETVVVHVFVLMFMIMWILHAANLQRGCEHRMIDQ